MRIGIVVTDTYSPFDPDHDTPLLVAALRERGAQAEPVVWHRDQDWSAFDLLVLRSPWDYPVRFEEFSRWLETAGAATRVLNSPSLVRWNLDKRYLAELEGAGVAVVPTAYLSDAAALAADLAARQDAHVVLKPAISAGARDTGLFAPCDPEAQGLAERVIARGGVVMVQPEVPELSEGAEKALYLIDGRFTHAVAKGALLARGGGLIGGEYEEHPELVEASTREIAFAEAALAAVVRVTGEELPLYARIDTVDSAAYGLVVLEAELFEPALNLHLVPELVGVVADAVLARLA